MWKMSTARRKTWRPALGVPSNEAAIIRKDVNGQPGRRMSATG
jgi:hypothetical protein